MDNESFKGYLEKNGLLQLFERVLNEYETTSELDGPEFQQFINQFIAGDPAILDTPLENQQKVIDDLRSVLSTIRNDRITLKDELEEKSKILVEVNKENAELECRLAQETEKANNPSE
ncbi:hypothetical protein PCE1_001989 [Barthelona sp. PCE]